MDRSGRGLLFKCYHGICSEGLSNSTQNVQIIRTAGLLCTISEYSVVKVVDRSGRGLLFKCYRVICSEGLSDSTQDVQIIRTAGLLSTISEYSIVKVVDRSGRGLLFKCYHVICSEGQRFNAGCSDNSKRWPPMYKSEAYRLNF